MHLSSHTCQQRLAILDWLLWCLASIAASVQKRNCHHKPCSCKMQKEKCILARLGAASSSFMLPLAKFEFAMLHCFRGISNRLCRTQRVLGLRIRLLTAFQLPQLLIFTFTETCPWDWTSARRLSQSWPAYRCFVNRSKFEVYCKNPSCGRHEFRQCQHLKHGCLGRMPKITSEEWTRGRDAGDGHLGTKWKKGCGRLWLTLLSFRICRHIHAKITETHHMVHWFWHWGVQIPFL